MGARLRLPARIALAVVVGALAVATGMALVLGNTISLRNSAGATIATNRYLLAVANTERLVVDAETGLRGYVITEEALFLEPLTAAVNRFPRNAALLQQAAEREKAFTDQAQALISAIHAYLTSYVPSVVAEVRRDPSAARSRSVTLRGKRLVDDIRARTAALEAAVSRRQTERQQMSQSSANSAVAEAIAVLVALTLLTALLGAFLGRLAVSRDRARARSQRTSEILQRSLLPHTLPAVPGCELAVRFRPAGAGELVGGDFYDVFAAGHGRWAIVLGDVCGKGAEAAAITAMARWTLRSYIPETEDPGEPLRFLNQAMLRQDLDGRFITVAYLLVRVEAERAHVSVACAGHPAPIHAPTAAEPAAVRARGPLLGVWPDIDLDTERVELMPGDGLVAYTDGVTDQGPGFPAGAPSEMLAQRDPRPSAEGLASALERYADRFHGPPQDDVAIVALCFRGGQDGRGRTPAKPGLADHAVVQD